MSLLTELQAGVRERLLSDEFYKGPIKLEVITEDLGDILNMVETAIAKIGACVVVLTPKMSIGETPVQLSVDVVLGIFENVVVNRSRTGTQKPALRIAETLIAMCHDWSPADKWTKFRFQGLELAQANSPVSYHATFVTQTVMAVE